MATLSTGEQKTQNLKGDIFYTKLYKHVQAHERGNESLLRVMVNEQVSKKHGTTWKLEENIFQHS